MTTIEQRDIEAVLSAPMLEAFRERAATYDRENRFFQEDFDDLRRAGYLRLAVPRDMGGMGATLAEASRAQRRLASYAPATALGVNMHLYWTGVAADLHRQGDHSTDWILREAANGEVFAAGHAESGEDIPLLLSNTHAERVDGGYRFVGRKAFGSLTPVWTYLGIHGIDANGPTGPRIVHAFMPRSTESYHIDETWDVMGMRATRSDDTILDGVFVPDELIPRVVPAGAAGIDNFVIGVFAWALMGFASVYYGLAARLVELTVDSMRTRAKQMWERPVSHHPYMQQRLTEMVVELEGIGAHLDRMVDDWSTGVDHGPAWGAKLVAAKYHVVEGAWRIADGALDLAGGWGMHKRNELERLFRDARAGRFHPANSLVTWELVAKTTLGIDPDATPRWG